MVPGRVLEGVAGRRFGAPIVSTLRLSVKPKRGLSLPYSPNAVSVLVVEDNPGDARMMRIILSEAGIAQVAYADTVAKAKAALAEWCPDVVLLDLSLPDGQGLEVIDALRLAAPSVAVVVVTGHEDEELALRAVQHGCQDYLIKGQGDGVLIRRAILYARERMAAEVERKTYADRLKDMVLQTVRTVSMTLEMRDPYTSGHQRRVAELAGAIGKRLGLEEQVILGLETGGLIHDIGKINIPAEFLSRPGKLSDEAFQVIRTHSAIGWEIVSNIAFPWPVSQMVRQHHERLDGSGYPDGLAGDDIILEARIIAVADVVEAIMSHRPYRAALGTGAAIDEIRRYSGSRYDREVVAACIAVIEEGLTGSFAEA